MNINKSFFIFFLIVSASALWGQELSKNTLGTRLSGSNNGYDDGGVGVELSYQRLFDDHLRGELDFGVKNSRYIDQVKLSGLLQGVWTIQGGFNWFAGGGFGLGYAGYDPSWPHYDDYPVTGAAFLALDGSVGLEYDFRILPFQIAFDIRPEVFFGKNYFDNFNADIGFALRYKFGGKTE